MVEIIEFLIGKGYEICLMSFCKKEGDEETIKSILNKCNYDMTNNIETYYYRGNLDEALNIIGDCSLVVGARFHSVVLGMALEKPVIPVIYSDKTKHLLEDMNINLKTIDIKKIESFDINSITQEDLEKIIDVKKQKRESEKHFEKLDKILK